MILCCVLCCISCDIRRVLRRQHGIWHTYLCGLVCLYVLCVHQSTFISKVCFMSPENSLHKHTYNYTATLIIILNMIYGRCRIPDIIKYIISAFSVCFVLYDAINRGVNLSFRRFACVTAVYAICMCVRLLFTVDILHNILSFGNKLNKHLLFAVAFRVCPLLLKYIHWKPFKYLQSQWNCTALFIIYRAG